MKKRKAEYQLVKRAWQILTVAIFFLSLPMWLKYVNWTNVCETFEQSEVINSAYPFFLAIVLLYFLKIELWKDIFNLVVKPYYSWIDTIVLAWFLANIYLMRENNNSSFNYYGFENYTYFYVTYIVWVILRAFNKEKRLLEKNKNTTIYSDKAIDSSSDDELERGKFAKTIADVFERLDSHSSLVVGIYGGWGTGKTSVMNLLANYIDDKSNSLVIRFNPWSFSNKETVLHQFLTKFQQALIENCIGNSSILKSAFERYINRLSLVSLKMGVFNFSFKNSLDGKLDDVMVIKSHIDALLEDANCKIIVMMDDIDRLRPSEISEVFSIVKLIADFSNTNYVLAFDKDVVSSVIEREYFGSENSTGPYIEEFLEKIVQLPVYIPASVEGKLEGMLFSELNKIVLEYDLINDEYEERIEVIRDAICDVVDKGTLRKMKRALNAFSFSAVQLVGEVNVLDLIIIELFKIYFPEMYFFILSNSAVLVLKEGTIESFGKVELQPLEQKVKQDIEVILKKYNVIEQECIYKLFKELFPYAGKLLEGTFNVNYGVEKELRKIRNDNRLCSPECFELYFCRFVPNDKMSNQDFSELLSNINEMEVCELATKIQKYNIKSLFSKISSAITVNDDFIQCDSVKKLTLALIRNWEIYTRDEGGKRIGGMWTRAAILISTLLEVYLSKCKNEGTNIEYCKEVIREAKHIGFMAEILRCAVYRKIFQENEIEDMNAFLGVMIKNEIQKENTCFLEKYLIDIKRILDIYIENNNDDISEAVMKWFKKTQQISEFLSQYCIDSKFEEVSYQNVKRIVNPDKLIERINRDNNEVNSMGEKNKSVLRDFERWHALKK